MNKKLQSIMLFMLSLMPLYSYAGDGETQPLKLAFIGLFAGITLLITYISFRSTKNKEDYYAAGKNVSSFNNGLALAGDYLSAASFLAISALVFSNGFDGLIFSIGWLVGWPVLSFILGERIKNLAKYTWGDALSYRFKNKSVRVFTAVSTLIVVLLYIVAQMVGAGKLMTLFFGIDSNYGMMIVGFLTLIYVAFGGMKATTKIQIFKAILLLGSVSFMAIVVLNSVNWNPTVLFVKATDLHTMKDSILVPGGYIKDPVSAISIGLALMFGTAGLPHILQRLLTVKDSIEARKSVVWATNWIGYFYFLTFIIGFGAIIFLNQNPELYFKGGNISEGVIGGKNMVAVLLANATGGEVFGQFVITVAFATIIAVVTGLTLAGTSAIAHDLLGENEENESKSLIKAKVATVAVSVTGVGLGIALQSLDVGFMVTLAFAVASSSIVPALMMSILWKDSTTKGVVVGGWAGLISSIVLTILSPSIWVEVLHFSNSTVLFPFASPTLFTMIIAFATIWVVSLWDNSENAELERLHFDKQQLISEFGEQE